MAGEIQGEFEGDRIEHLTEKAYRYPLLLDKQAHIWKDHLEVSSSYTPLQPRSFYDDRGMGVIRY